MQISYSKKYLLLGGLLFLFACTPSPQPTLTPQPTFTSTPSATPQPTLTPTPSPIWVTLGSPFASDCGDGIPRIWSNDSFNGPWKDDSIDEYHGHVDIFVPKGVIRVR